MGHGLVIGQAEEPMEDCHSFAPRHALLFLDLIQNEFHGRRKRCGSYNVETIISLALSDRTSLLTAQISASIKRWKNARRSTRNSIMPSHGREDDRVPCSLIDYTAYISAYSKPKSSRALEDAAVVIYSL